MQYFTKLRQYAENSPMVLLLSFIFLLAILLACWKIGQPGLYYDEMLFSNAAVGGRTDDFVTLRVAHIPFLLMQYIGALKAWIYYPVFSVFPVNYWSVRLPSILLGATGGLFLVMALYRGFGRSAAVAGAIMILLDPTMIIHSRLDWGPNALMFFFRGLLIWLLVMWISTQKAKWAWLALAACILGVFDKLNFLWLVMATLGALVLFYRRTGKAFARDHSLQAVLLIILVGAGSLFAISRGVRLAEHQDIDWPHRITQALGILRLTLSGGGALDFICGNGSRVERWFWPGYVAAIVAGSLGWRSLARQQEEKRLYSWMVVLTLLVTAAFILTKSATGPHHSSMISGLWQLALAPLLGAAWNDRSRSWDRLRQWIVPICLTLIFAGNIIVCRICIRAFAQPINHNWDQANTTAALYARLHPEGEFISSDWGIGTLIIALTKDKPVINDSWPSFTDSTQAVQFVRGLPADRDLYFYSRLPGFETFSGNRVRLLQALDRNGLHYQTIDTYQNWQGQPMIEIGIVRARH